MKSIQISQAQLGVSEGPRNFGGVKVQLKRERPNKGCVYCLKDKQRCDRIAKEVSDQEGYTPRGRAEMLEHCQNLIQLCFKQSGCSFNLFD